MLAQQQGVAFRYGTSIDTLRRDGDRLGGVATPAGVLQADAYLLALGSHTPQLLKPVGIHIPVYPVKGYSITVPITDPRGAPESTVMDETHKVAVTRLGERIRVGGTAELAGYDLRLHEARRRTLEHVVSDLYPEGGDVSRASFWCGLRPMTPDGTPVIGATRHQQSLPCHRPWHARLDDGGRHGARDGRPDLRSQARGRSERAHDRALRECLPLIERVNPSAPRRGSGACHPGGQPGVPWVPSGLGRPSLRIS